MQILFTGLTFKDVENRENETDVEGICYLCKRRGGEDSLTLQGEETSEYEMIFRPIELDTFAMGDEKEAELLFSLCKECQILLGLNSSEDE